MKKLISTLFFYINIGVIVLTFCSILAQWIDPRDFWWFGPLGLAYPYLIAINLLFILHYVIFRSNRWKWSLIVILLNPFALLSIFQIQREKPIEGESIKVMSYNIRLFNKYGWEPDRFTGDNIIQFVAKERADILLFQEFYDLVNHPEYNHIKQLVKAQKCNNHFFESYISIDTKNQQQLFGLATFTHYPIVNEGIVYKDPVKGKARAIYTDLAIHGDTVRVYNVHLRSLGFSSRDLSFIENVTGGTKSRQYNLFRNVVGKVKEAFVARAEEAEVLVEHIEESPYPVLLGGDFNDTPFTYTYRLINNALSDSFKERGFGFGQTYEGHGIIPRLRIDYLMSSEEYKPMTFKRHTLGLSDHDPIVVEYMKNE